MGINQIHTSLGIFCIFSAGALLLFSLYTHETTACCSNWPKRRKLLTCLLGYYGGTTARRESSPRNGGSWRTPCLYLTLALVSVSLAVAPESGGLVYALHAAMVAMSVGVYCTRTMAGCICSGCKRRRKKRVWSGIRKSFKRLGPVVRGVKR